jgi:hypothetical protein
LIVAGKAERAQVDAWIAELHEQRVRGSKIGSGATAAAAAHVEATAAAHMIVEAATAAAAHASAAALRRLDVDTASHDDVLGLRKNEVGSRLIHIGDKSEPLGAPSHLVDNNLGLGNVAKLRKVLSKLVLGDQRHKSANEYLGRSTTHTATAAAAHTAAHPRATATTTAADAGHCGRSGKRRFDFNHATVKQMPFARADKLVGNARIPEHNKPEATRSPGFDVLHDRSVGNVAEPREKVSKRLLGRIPR